MGEGEPLDIKKEEMLFTRSSLSVVDPGPNYANMVARDEKQLVKARKDFYDNVKVKHERYLKMCEWFAKKGIPLVIGVFSFLYWSFGLYHYFKDDVRQIFH